MSTDPLKLAKQAEKSIRQITMAVDEFLNRPKGTRQERRKLLYKASGHAEDALDALEAFYASNAAPELKTSNLMLTVGAARNALNAGLSSTPSPIEPDHESFDVYWETIESFALAFDIDYRQKLKTVADGLYQIQRMGAAVVVPVNSIDEDSNALFNSLSDFDQWVFMALFEMRNRKGAERSIDEIVTRVQNFEVEHVTDYKVREACKRMRGSLIEFDGVGKKRKYWLTEKGLNVNCT